MAEMHEKQGPRTLSEAQRTFCEDSNRFSENALLTTAAAPNGLQKVKEYCVWVDIDSQSSDKLVLLRRLRDTRRQLMKKNRLGGVEQQGKVIIIRSWHGVGNRPNSNSR